MQQELRFKSLAELFHWSLSRTEILDTICLEVIRSDREEAFTFAELKSRAANLAARLISDSALKPRDKVVILSKNRTEWDIALWAAILAGAVPVLVDPERTPDAVANHVMHTDSRLIFMADDYADPDSRDRLKEIAAKNSVSLIEMDGLLGRNSDPQHDHTVFAGIRDSIQLDDTAAIVCTSGTTGDPREVELTNRNLIANIQGTLYEINITSQDILGHIIPAHHSFGLTIGKLLTLWAGATNVYTNKYRRIAHIMKEKQITVFAGIPTLYTLLAKKLEDSLAEEKKRKRLVALLDKLSPATIGKQIVKKMGWEKLRFFVSGAAPVPHWVLQVFWKRGLKLYQGYGTTENSPVCGFCEDPKKLGSVGRPIPTMLVRILDENGKSLPPGEKGEITLGGPCIMKGYYKNPASTDAVVFTDDRGIRWLRTGDLGCLDEDGHLFVTGRKKFIIVLAGGKNVNPELVESALSQARFVREILVVPGFRETTPGVREEIVKAIVQPEWDELEAHTETRQVDLIEQTQLVKDLLWQSINHCQQNSAHLSHFERVTSAKHLEITLEEFEKTSTGKIKRQIYISQQ